MFFDFERAGLDVRVDLRFPAKLQRAQFVNGEKPIVKPVSERDARCVIDKRHWLRRLLCEWQRKTAHMLREQMCELGRQRH